MKHTIRFTVFALLLLALFSLAGPAQAQDRTVTDDEVNAIARDLYCPVCESTPLDVCPTEACKQWRELIREKLAEGWTEDQIKDYFVEQYGVRVLSQPPATGVHWLIYAVPPIIFVVGLILLINTFRSMKAEPAEAPAETPAASPNDEYARRLEEELKKRK